MTSRLTDCCPPQRRYRGASLDARRAERRERLLAAALDCFGGAGYHQTSVRSLCQTAGLTERYFYESFEHSEQLLQALYRQLTERLEAEMLTAIEATGPDPEAMSRAALDTYYRYNEDPRIARVTHFEILGVSAEVDALYRDAMDRFARLIIERIAPRLPATVRRGPQIDFLATGLVGAVVQITMRWLLDDHRAPRRVVLGSAMTLFSAVITQLGVAGGEK